MQAIPVEKDCKIMHFLESLVFCAIFLHFLFAVTHADDQYDMELEEPRSIVPLIIGGSPASIEEVPYQVGVFIRVVMEDSFAVGSCGGSILTPSFILTAAHCVDPKIILNSTRSIGPKMKVGVLYGSDISQLALVMHPSNRGILDPDGIVLAHSIHIHPDWDHDNMIGDIAILGLDTPIPLSPEAQPVVLRAEQPKGGEIAMLAGWGARKVGGPAPVVHLQKTNMAVLDGLSCAKKLIEILDSDVTTTDFSKLICAGSPDGNGCLGDSGGPLTTKHQQIGIVSFGAGSKAGCDPTAPAVYTSVSAYRDFIDKVTRNTAIWA